MGDAPDSQFRDTDRRVRNIDLQVGGLDSRLDVLEGEHERLKSRFGYTQDLDHELRSIRDDISGLKTTTEEADGRLDELDDRVTAAERTVKRLTRHVRLVEGQVFDCQIPVRERSNALLSLWKARAFPLGPCFMSAELTQKKLKRGAHRSVQALERDIRAWIALGVPCLQMDCRTALAEPSELSVTAAEQMP
ncbi:hypothetical protein [Streptomyces sp. NPDC049970]|uniref:hypothetical protein n=1 Tax=Streptomyces sp. NPDC049970 TaxID=3155033 RepID=UPI003429A7E9